MKKYIIIQNGRALRDVGKNGKKGHIHSIIGESEDGLIVEHSKIHNQIIQRCFYPEGKIDITCFRIDENNRLYPLKETTMFFIR